MNIFNSPEYVRSRKFYIVQCSVFYFVTLLMSDAFLAKLLSYMGMNDSLVGIVSTFISLSMVTQLSSFFTAKAKISKKSIVTTFYTISTFLFAFVYVVPFLPFNGELKNILIIGSLLLAYMFQQASSPLYFPWANAYVESNKRGEFSAVKEMFSLIGGIVFTLIAGYVVNIYEGLGKIETAFIIIASSIVFLNIISFISLTLIKKEDEPNNKKQKKLKDSVKYLLKNKCFRNIILLNLMFDTGRYFTFGFLGIFKLNDLGITLFNIQLINFIAQFVRAVLSKPFGRYTDKTSYAKGIRLALTIMMCSFIVLAFTNKSTWYLVIIHTVLYNISLAGIEQNTNNILYSFVEDNYLSEAVSIKNFIAGIVGFSASLVAGWFMAYGMGVQALAVISSVILLITIIYLIKVVEKQKKLN